MQSQLNSTQRKTKSVRFASTLATVRCFDINQTPASVCGSTAMTLWSSLPSEHSRRLLSSKVILESISLDNNQVLGQVRVHNLAFEKRVTLRYSLDNWASYQDHDLHFLRPVYNSPVDQDVFQFRVQLPEHLCTSTQCDAEFVMRAALRYCVNGQEFWDNNLKRDYTFVITPKVHIDPTEYEWQVSESGTLPPKKRTGLCAVSGAAKPSPFLEDSKLFASKSFDNLENGFAVPHQPPRRPALPSSAIRLKPKALTPPTFTFVPTRKVAAQPKPVPAAVPFFDLPMPFLMAPEPPLRRSFFDSIPVSGPLPKNLLGST
ncbi:Protein phosphatase 1 regulatory subunit 3E [Entomophthora muscae]|uniref:Protein phosphatase 1 regulatory subunit 3E n=1 Tax=Entomophthora muscae TaxID=34485 RepID=A0ACC2UIP3_9FUNG|nr:Protein phosphatase 1 regulatory subunit 3E [Entomophthora muscae]